MRRWLVWILLAAVVGTACRADPVRERPEAIPSGCGLPTPGPRSDPGDLPEAFLLDGDGELVRVSKRKGGIVASINVPYSVARGFELYKEAAQEAGFRLAGEENEGFEAEIYLRAPGRLASIQIRRSVCADASIVFVSIVSRRSLGG